jgi:hypothetical protein
MRRTDARALLLEAKAELRRAQRAEAARNVAVGGNVMDRPATERLLKAEDAVKAAKRRLWRSVL